MKTIRYQNNGTETATFEIGDRPGSPPTRYHVAPGECVDLPAGYCQENNEGRANWVQRRLPHFKRVELGSGTERKAPKIPVQETPAPKVEKAPVKEKPVKKKKLPKWGKSKKAE